uniref:Carboxymuconolactone decarboxylase-like domain-containing protein n=1 Tax=Schlesneria paludicola TaxID=360056 RepID=A0A7C2P2F2_9PLAN
MTWIRTISKSQADETYRQALDAQHAWYPPEYEAQVPGLPANDGDGIVAALSLIPNALHHHFTTFGSLMDPALPLSRRQHELIATVVSQANCTRYCSVSHREFLRRATGDAALVDAVQKDYRTAPLTDAERAMCDYADQLTRDATKLQRSDIERLRSVGFDDRGILQITLIAAWFNSINRVADALGVGRD